jgi:hypothetical protein
MMGWKTRGTYDQALGLRESENITADTFKAEFSVVTGRTVEILQIDSVSPDRIALIYGIKTGVELTSIRAGSVDDVIHEVSPLASKKYKSYERRSIFDGRPIIMLGVLNWPARDIEGPALYDVHEELAELFVPLRVKRDLAHPKYTSRRDPLLLLRARQKHRVLVMREEAPPLLGSHSRFFHLEDRSVGNSAAVL